jgi:Domain of unknown function (DUF4279)
VFTNSLGRSRTAKSTLWCLSSEGAVTSRDARRHLDWLLDCITPRARELDELRNTYDLRVMVHFTWWSRYGKGGPMLWARQLATLGVLNLDCHFELGF